MNIMSEVYIPRCIPGGFASRTFYCRGNRFVFECACKSKVLSVLRIKVNLLLIDVIDLPLILIISDSTVFDLDIEAFSFFPD